ncbi:MAG TPA: hypothetical protein VD862_03885 [Candidatus Paceibacterota bacterium]|nr:hypothetical protein [Candidatus Paceibacterota bacterium]
MALTKDEYEELHGIGRDLDHGVGSLDRDTWNEAVERYNELLRKQNEPEPSAQ